jgi:hypothetical protein
VVLEFRVEEADRVFNETERPTRWILVGAVADKQFFKAARMKTHQQLDPLARYVGEAMSGAWRNADEIAGAELEDFPIEQEKEAS